MILQYTKKLYQKTFFLIICLLILIFYIWSGEYSQLFDAIMMCSFMSIVLYVVWDYRKVSVFFLFLVTFIFLFIGGRFWAELFDQRYNLKAGTFFETTGFTGTEWKQTLTYICLFLCFSTLGFLSFKDRKKNIKPKLPSIDINRINVFFDILFVFLLVSTIYGGVRLLLTMSDYHSFFSEQSKFYSVGRNVTGILSYVSFGLVFAFGNKKNKIKYVALFFLRAVFSILAGTRGAFGTTIIFIIYLIAKGKKVDIIKLGAGFLVALFLLLFLFSYSIRQQNSESSLSFLDFVYSQGISMSVFTQSMSLSYPILPYFQSIIPGSSAIYSLITGNILMPYDTSFASHLSHSLNADLFDNGQGLGWSALSDVYVYSGGIYILFCFIAFVVGRVMNYMEIRSKQSPLAKTIMYSIVFHVFLWPRAGINTIFPLAIYAILFYYIFSYLFQSKSTIILTHS